VDLIIFGLKLTKNQLLFLMDLHF